MKKTILVVEDFKTVLEFICEILQEKGYSTIGAANGNEAFTVISELKNEIHLVVTDYYMPDCTGFELLQKLKLNPDYKNIPVIFLTTETNIELIKNAKEAGLAAWIKKPYKSDHFFNQIEIALEHKN